MKFHPFHSPGCATGCKTLSKSLEIPPPGHSVPSWLPALSWPLSSLVYGWPEVNFLTARRRLVNSMPRWLLCALLTALRPSGCSATFLGIRHPPGNRRALGCSTPRSSVPFHPFGVLLAARHPRGHSALPGYFAICAILATRSPSAPPSHSAISCLP